MKHETKNETSGYYVSWFESIDSQYFQALKWNMKAKNVDGKIYVSEKPYFGRSETFWREISVEALFYSSFGFNKGGLKAQ